MAARLNMNTPLKITKSKPTKTIKKPQKLIKPRVDVIIPELPSQLLQSTEPEYTKEQWESYRADTAEKNYKRMIEHRDEIIDNVELFIEQYKYLQQNLRRASDILKQKNDELVYFKERTESLRKKNKKLKNKIKYEVVEPEPKKKNPAWIDRPIVIYLDDGEEGERADRELDMLNASTN